MQKSIRPSKAPKKWLDFLRNSKNKEEVFKFLSAKVMEFTFAPANLVYVTSGESVLHTGSNNFMSNCNDE